MKKISLFAIILFLILPMTQSTSERYNEGDILLSILHDLDAEFLEGDINIAGQISNGFKDKSEIKKISDEIIDGLGITGNKVDLNRDITDSKGQYYVKESIWDKGFNQVSIYGYDKFENPVSAVLTSYFDAESAESDTSIFINLRKEEQDLDISGIINNVYKKYGKPVDNTTCVIGTAPGRLDRDGLKKNVQNTLKKHKVKIIEKYQDEDVTSYTGYTPYIEGHMFSYKKRINLNLAIRYNEYEDRTYFWIATPIIATGY